MSFHLPAVEPANDVWILRFQQRHCQSPYFIFSSEVLGIEHRASFGHAPSLSWVPRANSDITIPKGDRVFGIDYYFWLVIERRVRVTKTTSWGGYCCSVKWRVDISAYFFSIVHVDSGDKWALCCSYWCVWTVFPFLEFGLNRCLLVWKKNLYVNYNVGLICHFMVDDLCKIVSEWYIHLNRNLGSHNPLLANASLFPCSPGMWEACCCVFLLLWGVVLLVFVFFPQEHVTVLVIVLRNVL